MPGVGKTYIGSLFSIKHNIKHIDTDITIENIHNIKLPDLVKNISTEKFLDIETSAVLSLNCENSIISTGGSVVFSNDAMHHLKNILNCYCIHLTCDVDLLEKRVNMKERGVVFKKGQTIEDVYLQRKPLYEKYEDVSIVSNENTLENIEKIYSELFI